jgi:hypothetical protein
MRLNDDEPRPASLAGTASGSSGATGRIVTAKVSISAQASIGKRDSKKPAPAKKPPPKQNTGRAPRESTNSRARGSRRGSQPAAAGGRSPPGEDSESESEPPPEHLGRVRYRLARLRVLDTFGSFENAYRWLRDRRPRQPELPPPSYWDDEP